MIDETIVAVYDMPEDADAAVRDLVDAGLPADTINQHAGSTTEGRLSSAVSATQEHGFWSRLFGGEPDHDPSIYDRSVASGSTVVTVRSPASFVQIVHGILERHDPVDLDDRASQYGLTSGSRTSSAQPALPPEAGRVGDTASLQLSEERLEVGKRLVDRGTTRVRRFVTEVPVEEQVALHDETVRVDRVPVADGRPVSDAAFTDRTIEMTETSEEAVIGKTVRVYEEIGLRRQASEHVETVRDTVRREDVEVIHVPATETTERSTASGLTPRAPKI